MQWMDVTIAALLAMAVILFAAWIRALRVYGRQKAIGERLQYYQLGRKEALDDLELPFAKRVIVPGIQKRAVQLSKILAPAKVKAELTRRLHQAGSKMTPEAFVLYRMMLALMLFAAGTVIAVAEKALPKDERLAIPLGMALLGYAFMGVRLNTQAQVRLRVLEHSLPEVFDLLSVSVEAGLAFDGAMRKLLTNLPIGPAKDEFTRLMSDIQLGMTRATALSALAERTKSRELKRFAGLVAQSDRTGSGIASALKVQARDIKETRAAQAREKAALIPVKIIFPMVLFIFPAIFIVILGPAMLSLIKQFHG